MPRVALASEKQHWAGSPARQCAAGPRRALSFVVSIHVPVVDHVAELRDLRRMPSPPDDFLVASVAAASAEVERVVHALRIGGIREEEDFTSQMLSALRSGLVRVRLDGFQWDSSVVKKQTEEPKIGADFAGVLRVRRDGYHVDKGFLAQAKLAGPHKRIVKSKLLVQAEAMLEISPASFVFLYRPTGVSVVPAISVVANGGEPRDLIEWHFEDFLLEHFRSFVGDRLLGATDEQTVSGVLEELRARQVIYMGLRRDSDEPGLA